MPMEIGEFCVLQQSEFQKERPLNWKGYVTKKRVWAADYYHLQKLREVWLSFLRSLNSIPSNWLTFDHKSLTLQVRPYLPPYGKLCGRGKNTFISFRGKEKKVQFRGKIQRYGLIVPLHRSLVCNFNVIFKY